MNLRDYLSVLRRRWITVAILCLLTLGVVSAVTLSLTPRYTATTRLFFGVAGGESATDLAQGSTFTEKQMSSYAQVATSPLVLDSVIDELRLKESASTLARNIEVSTAPDTVILEVSATDVDARRSAAIANSLASKLSVVTARLSPSRADGSQAVRATVLAQAQIPTTKSSPMIGRNLALGLLLGLLLGVGVALVRHLLDTKIRGEQDVQGVTDAVILGVVPFDVSAPSHPVVMHDNPLAARSEAMRRLRTNLQFVEVASKSKCIVVTSSIPGEGKSTTAINLAVSMADAGLRVVLVDADLRRPSVASYLGLEGKVGLTTVLIGRASIADVVQPWSDSTLDVLPAGEVPPNPSELLGSGAMSALLGDLAETYDMVILDSSPLLPVTDAALLSKVASGALVVVGADRLHRAQLGEALDCLATVDAHVLGIVLNKVARRDSSSYIYYPDYVAETDEGVTTSEMLVPAAGRSVESVS